MKVNGTSLHSSHGSKPKASFLRSEFVLNFDSFGVPANFNYGNGSATHRSSLGACINLFIMLFTLIFTIQQLIVLIERGATTFTSAELQDYNELSHSFRPDDGFRVAFRVFDERNPDFVVSESLITFEIKQIVVFFDDDGTYVREERTLPSFPCRQEDID